MTLSDRASPFIPQSLPVNLCPAAARSNHLFDRLFVCVCQSLPEDLADLLRLSDRLSDSPSDRFSVRFLRQSLPEDLADLLRLCLTPEPALRPSVADLLEHRVFSGRTAPAPSRLLQPFPLMLDSEPEYEPAERDPGGGGGGGVEEHLRTRPLTEVYHLWRLAGGDLETELRNQGRVKTKPPILTVPK